MVYILGGILGMAGMGGRVAVKSAVQSAARFGAKAGVNETLAASGQDRVGVYNIGKSILNPPPSGDINVLDASKGYEALPKVTTEALAATPFKPEFNAAAAHAHLEAKRKEVEEKKWEKRYKKLKSLYIKEVGKAPIIHGNKTPAPTAQTATSISARPSTLLNLEAGSSSVRQATGAAPFGAQTRESVRIDGIWKKKYFKLRELYIQDTGSDPPASIELI